MKFVLVGNDGCRQELPQKAFVHVSFVANMIEDIKVDDGVQDINLDEKLLTVLVQFLDKHADDEPVPSNWLALPRRALTDHDKILFKPVVGMELLNLMNAASMLGCQLMLNALAYYLGTIIGDLLPSEIQDYIGVHIEIKKEHEAHLRKIYAKAFY